MPSRGGRLEDPNRRPLDPGWRERHIRGQADGTMPPGKIQMRYEDGTLVFDRAGRPRMFSMHVANATIPGRPRAREVERRRRKAEDAEKAAVAARAVAAQVQRSIRPPAGRLFAVDLIGLLLIGPDGGIGTSERTVKALTPLAAGGRHTAAVLVAAGGWRDEAALGEALGAFAAKLSAIGLRVDRRKVGIRMAKLRTPSRARDAGDTVQ